MDMVGDLTLGAYFDELAATHGEKTAIIYEDAHGKIDSLSYKNLNEKINQSANFLISLGVKSGDRVAIHLLNSIEYVINFFAIAKIGAIIVPINANFIHDDALFIVKKTKPVLILTQTNFIQIYTLIKKSCKVKILDIKECKNELNNHSTIYKSPKFSNLNLAQIIFTSGTSSTPKGVMITHYNLIFAGFYSSWQINLNKDDRYLTAMPLWHIDAQCTAMMPTFSRGATFILLERYSAHKFWEQVIKHKATITETIPKMICTLMAQRVAPNEKNHSLKQMLFYLNLNDKDMQNFIDRFNIPSVLVSYGMSETIVGLIGDRPNERRKFPSIGRVGFCYEAKIIDKDGNELNANEKGEIYIKGEIGKSIFKGYYKDKNATKMVLNKKGWLHTGDIGYYDEQGYFYFVDRGINLIKISGENVSSIEVEDCISRLSGVFEVAVIGVPDCFNNELIKACVVLKEGFVLSADDIREFCSKHLAKFKVPSIIEFYENLPKTCTGKVRKNILKKEHKG